jgi:alcohol dehydrogenase class IV
MSYKDRFAFSFHAPTKIIYGEGSLKETGKEMDGRGVHRALVVTDVTLKDSPMVKSLLTLLGDRAAGLYGEAVPDSSLETVHQGAKVFGEIRADSLISIGGGSTMDTAKAIGVLAKKGKKDLREFLGFSKVGEPIVPHMAIPTTSGTASEVTMFATVKDHANKIKNLMSDPFLIPPVAILDPLLTVGLPPEMTAATGMDAMSHAVESFHARGYEPIADGLAQQAIQLLVRYLPRCLERGEDVEARGMQAIASTMAGMAFQNALVGCVHGMAHALGGMFGLHHGLANAILLPHGMRFNLPVCAPRYRQVAQAFGLDTQGKGDEEVGEVAIRAVADFTRQLGLPQRLSEVRIPKENLPEAAQLAVADPAMRSNIRKVTDPQEIVPVLMAAW